MEPTPTFRVWQPLILVLAGGLTGLAVHTTVRIEIYNYQMGGFLPRQERRDGDGSIVKWRVSAEKSVREWMERSYQLAEQLGEAVPPPEVREAKIAEAIARARLNSEFREFVTHWGLRQYLIAPGALILSLILVLGRRRTRWVRISGSVLVVADLTCLALMYYRGYWSSLGW